MEKKVLSQGNKGLHVRVPPPLHKRLNDWIKRHSSGDLLSPPEAVRRLVELGLSMSPSDGVARKPARKQREAENAYDF